jgi:hypothetical protein
MKNKFLTIFIINNMLWNLLVDNNAVQAKCEASDLISARKARHIRPGF